MFVEETIKCYYKKPCKIVTSRTSKKPNREFYTCNVSSYIFFYGSMNYVCVPAMEDRVKS